jgi:hypothetical protein
MHSEIHAALAQRHVDLCREEFLAIHRRQRPIEHHIAAGLDTYQLNFEARMRGAQGRSHLAALHPCKGRAARAETQLSGRVHGMN